MPSPTPFRAVLPENRLAMLRDQVRTFDWDGVPVLDEGGDPWAAGAAIGPLRDLCRYWVEGFDWRAEAARLNAFPQFLVELDGQTIHFLHERGSGGGDTALVLTHGWPGSVFEFIDVIDRFAHPERYGGRADDGIDVVVPALPGFGFSGRPSGLVGPRRIAALWDRLLRDVLGYAGYVAQGGDWGAMVSAMLGLHHANGSGGCRGVHLNYLGSRSSHPPATEAERDFDRRCAPWLADGRAYADVHRTVPNTFAFAMTANPVGQAAWILEKFHAWSDRRDGRTVLEVFGADRLLANLMLYAGTGSFASSTWIYRAAASDGGRVIPAGQRVEVPTAFASFPCEIRPRPPRELIERGYNLVRLTEYEQGGHFAALERPDDLVSDVTEFLGSI